MLSLQRPTKPAQKTTPNLLPTSIKHNGSIPTSSRYWSPKAEEDGTHTAYFRGRKLRGRAVNLPEGYQGVVLQKTEEVVSTKRDGAKGGALAEQLRRMEEGQDVDEDDMEGAGKEGEVKVMETKATFEDIVVWGHEMLPEDEDVYVKAVEEWIGFAEAAHSYEENPTK